LESLFDLPREQQVEKLRAHSKRTWMRHLWKLDEMRRKAETAAPAGTAGEAAIPSDKQATTCPTKPPATPPSSNYDWVEIQARQLQPRRLRRGREKADGKDQLTLNL
jgi:hypothetical protein